MSMERSCPLTMAGRPCKRSRGQHIHPCFLYAKLVNWLVEPIYQLSVQTFRGSYPPNPLMKAHEGSSEPLVLLNVHFSSLDVLTPYWWPIVQLELGCPVMWRVNLA